MIKPRKEERVSEGGRSEGKEQEPAVRRTKRRLRIRLSGWSREEFGIHKRVMENCGGEADMPSGTQQS